MLDDKEKDVIQVIQVALSLPDGTLTAESGVDDIDEWDSLGHLAILVALDKKLSGQVAGIKEMATASSVATILKLLKDNQLI